jgi:arylformamidase
MRFYDISVGISPDLPVWPGDGPIELERVRKIEDGSNANMSRISCSVHTGTHVDAPLHFLEGGAGVDKLHLEVLIGRVYVVELPDVEVLTGEVLDNAGVPPRTRRLLFKTKNSSFWGAGDKTFRKDYVGVDASGAEWIVRKGLQLVGVDYLSIASYEQTAEPHRILLKAGVVILEGLNLSEVQQGRYMLYCLPMKIMGSDGAPTRVILAGV